MEISLYIIAAIVGYLLGSISVAVLLCRWRYNEDVRNLGSRNAGATNVARVYGMGMGLVTFAGDILKTCLSMIIGGAIVASFIQVDGAMEWGSAIAAIGCLLGHCWPVFFKFRGGKGVSVSAAIGLLLDWRLFLILIAFFLVIALITKRVSIGSILAALCFPLVELLLGDTSAPDLVLGCAVALTVLIMHLGNIKRIINGTETPFAPKKKHN